MAEAALQIEPLLALLGRHGVDLVIIGGFSLSAHGVVRGTKDIDIVPAPDPANLRRLAGALRDLDAEVMLADDCEKESALTRLRDVPAPPCIVS